MVNFFVCFQRFTTFASNLTVADKIGCLYPTINAILLFLFIISFLEGSRCCYWLSGRLFYFSSPYSCPANLLRIIDGWGIFRLCIPCIFLLQSLPRFSRYRFYTVHRLPFTVHRVCLRQSNRHLEKSLSDAKYASRHREKLLSDKLAV
jgi:hypothetical protein